jgi:methionyl-tRNA formyltransferase
VLKVVFFGTCGEYTAEHLRTVAGVHRVLAVVCAHDGAGLRGAAGRALRAAGIPLDPCTAMARRLGIPLSFSDRSGTHPSDAVSALRPDVVCIAGYPWLLPPGVWRTPRLGALNSHPSLLPRHRGILPLFWIYYHGDERTGVTVHRVTDRADAGDIVCREVYPLPRGLPVDRLNALNAERGGSALLRALDLLDAGRARGCPQDEAAATSAPWVVSGTPMVDWGWDVERVWHFLAGLCPWFIEPLRDETGQAVRYAGVLGYERCGHPEAIAAVRRTDFGWRLYCAGGVVSLGRRAGAYNTAS